MIELINNSGLKYFLLISVTISTFSCKQQEAQINKNLYDINIEYLNAPILDDRDMPDDTLMIVFYGNFHKDTVSLSINQKLHKTKHLTTDPRSGESGEIKTIKYKDIQNLGIRINNGNLVFIEPPKRQYNIQLIYLDSLVSVRFHRRLPAFD